MTLEIAVGMTTAPRQGFCYAVDTLSSLESAGFRDIRVFDDRDKSRGARGNALHAAGELLRDNPDAEAVLIFQDDLRAAQGLAGYLQRSLWPEPPERIGVVSLFTPGPRDREDVEGWHLCDLEAKPSVTGGVGILMPRHAAERLLENPPRQGSRNGWDISLRLFCLWESLSWWYHSPSLLKHTGEISSIAVWPNDWPARQCARFCEDASLLSVPMIES